MFEDDAYQLATTITVLSLTKTFRPMPHRRRRPLSLADILIPNRVEPLHTIITTITQPRITRSEEHTS